MLNSGEVPNLFPAEEYEKIIAAVRPKAKEHGISEGDRYTIIIITVAHYRRSGNFRVKKLSYDKFRVKKFS